MTLTVQQAGFLALTQSITFPRSQRGIAATEIRHYIGEETNRREAKTLPQQGLKGHEKDFLLNAPNYSFYLRELPVVISLCWDGAKT